MRISECLAQPNFCLPEATKTNVAIGLTVLALGHLLTRSDVLPRLLQGRVQHQPPRQMPEELNEATISNLRMRFAGEGNAIVDDYVATERDAALGKSNRNPEKIEAWNRRNAARVSEQGRRAFQSGDPRFLAQYATRLEMRNGQ